MQNWLTIYIHIESFIDEYRSHKAVKESTHLEHGSEGAYANVDLLRGAGCLDAVTRGPPLLAALAQHQHKVSQLEIKQG